MLHDRKGNQLKIGDEVWIPCKVVSTMDQAPYSFLRVTPLENAKAITGTYKDLFFVECNQVELITGTTATEQATAAVPAGHSKR